MNKNSHNYLLSDLSKLKGVGKKIENLLRKKGVNNIFDLLWKIPKSYTDRSHTSKINELKISEIQTISVIPYKYQFPRVRNLPNRVLCKDETGVIECVFFNSYEGYIKKILPINKIVTISGKISYFRNKYQITNPKYVSENEELIKSKHNEYSLTDGISQKVYNKIINQILENLPNFNEWHNSQISKKFNHISWNQAIIELHKAENIGKFSENFYQRLIFDEIFSYFLVNSEIRKKIKKIKKQKKIFSTKIQNSIISKLDFKLTKDQIKTLEDINLDLKSNSKMFRLLQGDVGSGKTIVALLSAINSIKAGFQVALLAPTEILARQHYKLASKIFPTEIKLNLLSSKSQYKEKKEIINDLSNQKIDLIFGTHAIFQKKIKFKKLGLIIIDEQHKFGVNQRKKLSDKGGDNCDVLLMSATPIPRTLTMTIYGDMDISIIREKPKSRKDVITYSKLEENLNDVLKFIKKELDNDNQIFWVCPLIDESKKLDHTSAIKKYEFLSKIFPKQVALLHGKTELWKIKKEF